MRDVPRVERERRPDAAGREVEICTWWHLNVERPAVDLAVI